MKDEPQEHSRTVSRRRDGVETTISRSLRVPTDLWGDAQSKAKQDGVAINRVITHLIEGYVHGVYLLPTHESVTVTTTYPPQPRP